MKKKSHILFFCAFAPYSLFSNPQGFDLKSGDAVLSTPNPSTLSIHTSNQAIINWESFSISQGEITRFVMPGKESAVLNRVVGGNLSEIYGHLEANGKVFLINPKGIIFGEDAQINAASFFASTLDALDIDFLKGAEIAFCGDSKSSIINMGTISAWDGDVALIAYHIDNQGVLEARHGVAALAAGTNILLSPQGNQRILIRACSIEKNEEAVGINNSGTITALQAELKADGNPYQFAIKDSGHVDALAVEQRGGHIYLVAEGGRLDATGSYNAAHSDGQGGQIHFLANDVYLYDEAVADVSGGSGGGTILIGGDYQGKNPEIPNANVTFVGDTVALKADATDCGNGGKVILWGEEGTGFFGEIFARGGELGGDGGFVEVSSPGHLDFNGIADRSSPQGKDGMLFLDPCNVTISTSGNTGYSYHASTSPTYTFSGSTANINNGTLGSNLNSGPVQIFAGTGYSGTAPSGSITFNPGANVSWSKTNSLDMRCDGGPIQINSVITSTSTGFGSNPVVYMLADSLTIGKSDHSLTADCGISIASGEVQFLGSQTGGFAIYGGTGASSAEGFIKTAGSGCEVDISGVTSISLEAGTSATAGAQGAYIKATSGSSTVSLLVNTGSAGDITITAGAGTGSNDAGIFFTGSATGDVNVSANRAVIITGGSGAPSSAGIQATGKMTVYGYGNGGATPDIIVQGGTTANTPAFIELINSSSKMNLAGWSYGISILGGSGSNSPAYITATGSSPIPIGGGSVTLAGGTGSNSPAYLSTNSGSITTLAQQIEFGGGFSLTGGSGSGSPAYITSTSGSINLNTAGSYPITLTGGNTGSGSGAYISTASAASTLTLASSTISLTGGNAASCAAEIYTAGTNLTLDLIRSTDSGSISLHGGAGDSSYAEIYTSGATTAAGTTRIAIGQTNAINGISLIGGSGPTKSSAKIATRTGGDILCTSKSSYTITGGTGSSESLAGIYTGVTSGSGNLNVTGTSYTLKGGDVGGTGNNRAEISTVNGGSIGLNSTSGTVTLQGYNAQTSDARIITQVGTSPITITTKGALSLLGGTGAQAAAEVATVAGGDITSTITGNYTITGGTGSTDSRAGFYAGFTSGSGGVSLSGAGYSLTGGLSGTGTNSAEILAAAAGGSISLTSNGSPLTLLAQGATASDARIAVQSSGTMMINNISTFSATGGSGTTARAIVATNQGGSITITGSGNYTIAGGTSANNSYAGIYAGLSSGSGSVTLSGGGYSLTGGLSGTGTNSAEILASGAGGLISLTSNGSPLTLLARGATASDARIATQGSGDITIHNISTFSATGGAGDTARAIVATNQGGSITIIGTGDHTMTGGTSGTESRAGIYAGLTSGSGGISMAGNSYTLTGGAMGAGFNRAEISSSGGDINLTASLGPSKLQGGGGSNTATRIVANTSGSISFNAGGAVSLLGSTTATGTNALASMTTANGNIALSALGLLTLQGGGYSGTSAQIATGSAANTITAQSIGITLQGGTAAGAFAEISTVGGAISIDGTTNGAGSISLAGNTADSTYAQIITTGTPQAANMIQIGQMSGAGIVHPTSITLAGSSGTTSSRAIIATDTGGNILSTITGNYTFTGGQTNGAASDDGRAGIYAGLSSGSGGITLAGNSFTLTGGPLGIGINRAEIISSGGDINLTASSGPNKLQGGGGSNSAARILANTSGAISFNSGGAISLLGSTTATGTNALASMTTANGNISLNAAGLITLQGGGYSGTSAQIATGSAANTITAQSIGLTLQGGTAAGAFAEISTVGGVISIDGTTSSAGSISLAGNTADSTYAQIITKGTPQAANMIQIGQIAGAVHPTSITLAGGSGTTSSRAIIATDTGGTILSTISGNYTFTGGQTNGAVTDDGRAGIYAGLTSGSGGITLAGNSYTLTGGPLGIGINRAEIISSGGDINLTASSGPNKLQGGGGSNSAARILANTSGSISFTSGGAISLLGSPTATGTNALASMTTANGNIALNTAGLLTLQGGGYSGTSAQIATGSAANTITAQSIGLTLQGGTAAGAFAEISTVGGAISIDGTTSSAGGISLVGNTADSTYAQIITTGTPQATDMIQIGQMSGVAHPTSITLAGGSGTTSSRAIIATDTGGNILCTTTGNYSMTGGTSANDSRAGIYAGLSSGSGSISLTGAGYSLTGGLSGAGTNSAEILSSGAGGAISLTSNNSPLILLAQGATTSDARIATLGSADISIQNISTFSATGGSGTTARAIVETDQGGSIAITGSGNYTMTGGTSGTDSRAGIYAGLSSGSGSISLTGAGYSLTGGLSGAGTNSAEILASGAGGAISLTSNNSPLTLLAQGATTSDARIATQGSGDITINNISAFSATGGSGTTARAIVATDQGGDITITGSGNYTITGGQTNVVNTDDGRAGIYAGLASGSGGITLTGASYTLTGGPLGIGINRAEISSSGGDISLTASSGPNKLQGGGGSNSAARILANTSGSISFTSGGAISLLGSPTATGTNALASMTTANGNIALNAVGLLTLQGGGYSGTSAQIATGSAANTITAQSIGLTLQGGTAAGAFAEISTVGGAISIDGTTSSAGGISLVGNTADSTYAQIITTGTPQAANMIQIGQMSGVAHPTSITLAGNSGTTSSRAIIATDTGGNILCTTTGNYSMTGGTSANDSRAGIYAGLSSGSGSVTLSGGGYSLTGGLSGAGTNSAEILASGAGGAISITSNNSPLILLAQGAATSDARIATLGSANITINNISTFSATGGSGTTARAIVATNQGGSIGITASGNYTMTGGTSGTDSRAGIYAGLSSGSGSVTLSGGGYSLTGGLSGAGTNSAEILSSGAGGAISLTSNNSPLALLAQGATTSDARIATLGSANIAINNISAFSATGGSGTTARAIVETDQGGSIGITASGNYTMTGGTSGTDSRAGIYAGLSSGSGSVTLSGGGYSLTGGLSGAGTNSAEILASGAGGAISLTSNNSPLALLAQGAATSDARIATLGSANITINNISTFSATGGSGTTARAIVATNQGGAITVTASGDYMMTGGQTNGAATDNGSAGFYAGLASGSGNITMTGNSYALTGGQLASSLGINRAEISTGTGGGAISITSNSGTLSLNGGSGNISDARIITQDTANSSNITILKSGNFSLMGGAGANSNAEVNARGAISSTAYLDSGSYFLTGGSGASSLARFTATQSTRLGGYDFTLIPGSSGSSGGSNAIIESTGADSFVILRAKNHISVSGNAQSNQSSLIQTTATSGLNPITIYCQGLALNGGSAASSSAQIVTDRGSIRVLSAGNVSMTGGSASGADAWIHSTTRGTIVLGAYNLNDTGGAASTNAGINTQSGNIGVLCLNNCTYAAPNATGLGLMRTLGSDLFVTANGSINLSGFTVYSTPDPGHLLLIAGSDITIGTNTQVIANGTSNSSLSLVVDAHYPVSPLIGPGEFILDAGSTVSAGATTPVRIFTARRSQNTITAPINGTAFVAGPQFLNSPTEQWGVYFPEPILGDPFTIFYKESGIPIIPPVIPMSTAEVISSMAAVLQRAAFVDSEMFFDLSEVDAYAFDDFFYFSSFDVILDESKYTIHPGIMTSFDVVDDKGLSIRRRKYLNKPILTY